jgi:hypothetical protein
MASMAMVANTGFCKLTRVNHMSGGGFLQGAEVAREAGCKGGQVTVRAWPEGPQLEKQVASAG